MDRERDIQQRVDAALASLDGIVRAEPAPFLHTRLMARMESAPAGPLARALHFLSRPAVAIALATLVLVLNGWILFNRMNTRGDQAIDPGMAYAAEYEPYATAFYENNHTEIP